MEKNAAQINQTSDLTVWFDKPAKKWTDALMIGNGSLGAMIFGDPFHEHLQCNEDTFWAGIPRALDNPDAFTNLAQARELVFKNDIKAATNLIEGKMVGKKSQPYEPLVDLVFDFPENDFQQYKRSLDISQSIAKVQFQSQSNQITREYFASFPDDCIVVKFQASAVGLNFNIKIACKHPHEVKVSEDADGLVATGRAPSFVDVYTRPNTIHYEESEGMRFQSELRILKCDGDIKVEDQSLKVTDAMECIFVFFAHTSFNGFDKNPVSEGKDPGQLCNHHWTQLKSKTYEQLWHSHLEDYQALFNRTALKLTNPEYKSYSDLPINKRLERIRSLKGKRPILGLVIQEVKKFLKVGNLGTHFWESPERLDDLGLVELYFQFGRYLMISSSRPGSQPINLQGIWNEHVSPPWGSNYTVNINLEMNYWPVETTNLSECFLPLNDFARECESKGRKTAKVNYGCSGWTMHHNSNLWRNTFPSFGSANWSYWPMGAGWVCFHLWEHFQFSQDRDYLASDAYPLMKGAAEFFMDWLVEHNGKYVTCPSTSPENHYKGRDGRRYAVSWATTADMAIIRETFLNCITAARVLDVDNDLQKKWQVYLDKMYPYQVAADGHLQEWAEDFRDAEPGHRHFSHLIGIHPANHINLETSPDLVSAGYTSLLNRVKAGGGATGWSCAWKVNQFARMRDADGVDSAIATLLEDSTYDNMFDAHPPFQIDGNFGGCAGIAEAIIQSHSGIIELLPAIPNKWVSGSALGLRVRGGLIASLNWKNHSLMEAEFHATAEASVKFRIPKGYYVMYNEKMIDQSPQDLALDVNSGDIVKIYLKSV